MLSRTVKRLRFCLHNRSSCHSFIDARIHETPGWKTHHINHIITGSMGFMFKLDLLITSPPPTHTHTHTHIHSPQGQCSGPGKFYTCSETLILGNPQCSKRSTTNLLNLWARRIQWFIIPDSKLIWHLLQGENIIYLQGSLLYKHPWRNCLKQKLSMSLLTKLTETQEAHRELSPTMLH